MSTAAQSPNPQHRTTALTSHKATKPPRSGFLCSVSWCLESRPRGGRAPSACPQLRSLPIRSTQPSRLALTKPQSHQGPVFWASCLGGLNPVFGMGESHSRVHSCAVPPSAAPNHRAYLSQSHQATKVRFSGSVSWWLESRLRDGRESFTCPQLRSAPIRSTQPPRLALTKSPSHQGPIFRLRVLVA